MKKLSGFSLSVVEGKRPIFNTSDSNLRSLLQGGGCNWSFVHKSIATALGYKKSDCRNSRRSAITKARHIMINFFKFRPMSIADVGDTDYKALEERYTSSCKRGGGSFIGVGYLSDYIIYFNKNRAFLILFNQKSFAIARSEFKMDDEGAYVFKEQDLTWNRKQSLKPTGIVSVMTKPKQDFAQDQLNTQSFNDMFSDIKAKFDKKTYVAPTTFTIKTRIFKDTGDFDAQLDSKSLEKLMGKADEFVSAMVNSGMDNTDDIHKLAVDLSVNHGIDYRLGKWFKKGNMFYHYYGTQNSKIFVQERGVISSFELNVKPCRSPDAVMHNCVLPISLENAFKNFIEVDLI